MFVSFYPCGDNQKAKKWPLWSWSRNSDYPKGPTTLDRWESELGGFGNFLLAMKYRCSHSRDSVTSTQVGKKLQLRKCPDINHLPNKEMTINKCFRKRVAKYSAGCKQNLSVYQHNTSNTTAVNTIHFHLVFYLTCWMKFDIHKNLWVILKPKSYTHNIA